MDELFNRASRGEQPDVMDIKSWDQELPLYQHRIVYRRDAEAGSSSRSGWSLEQHSHSAGQHVGKAAHARTSTLDDRLLALSCAAFTGYLVLLVAMRFLELSQHPLKDLRLLSHLFMLCAFVCMALYCVRMMAVLSVMPAIPSDLSDGQGLPVHLPPSISSKPSKRSRTSTASHTTTTTKGDGSGRSHVLQMPTAVDRVVDPYMPSTPTRQYAPDPKLLDKAARWFKARLQQQEQAWADRLSQ